MNKHHFFRKIFLTLMALVAWCGTAQAAFVGDRSDFRDETIYFVMTTRFYDGDPSNNVQCWDAPSDMHGDPAWRGDFKGLIDKLDYIKALGFTAIWGDAYCGECLRF
jgi:Glycosidases